MSQKSKNIWNQPLPLPEPLGRWYVMTVVVSFLFSLLTVIIADQGWHDWDLIELSTAMGVVVVLLIAFFRWLCCWRNFKRFAFGAACFATLVALFYAEENWRGEHKWQDLKHHMEASGEKLDFADFVPGPVPDDQNFAMAPVFYATDKLASRKWRDAHRNPYPGSNASEWDTNLVDPLDISLGPEPWPSGNLGNWEMDRSNDLAAWQNYYRELATHTNIFPVASQPQTAAQDILLALSKYDSVLKDLRQAAQRPDSRFPLDYDDEDPSEILLPHLAPLKTCSQILALRACAELQNGQADKALDDIKLMLCLADAVRLEPFIISHLVRIVIVQMALQPIWEGLAQRRWSDAQLAELDARLARFNFLAGYEFSVSGERAMHLKVMDCLAQSRDQRWFEYGATGMLNRSLENDFALAVEFYLIPRGWCDYGKTLVVKFGQNWLEPVMNDAQQTVSPAGVIQALNAQQPPGFDDISRLFVGLFMRDLTRYALKAAHGQTCVNLGRVAIALERYRLAHGELPASLDILSPQFIPVLPHDIIGGQSLKYHRQGSDQFVLYSVGWNGTDDNGVQVMGIHASPFLDLKKGDWVWKNSRE